MNTKIKVVMNSGEIYILNPKQKANLNNMEHITSHHVDYQRFTVPYSSQQSNPAKKDYLVDCKLELKSTVKLKSQDKACSIILGIVAIMISELGSIS